MPCSLAAAVGFAQSRAFSGRRAGVAARKPDGLDALALLLFKEAEQEWPALDGAKPWNCWCRPGSGIRELLVPELEEDLFSRRNGGSLQREDHRLSRSTWGVRVVGPARPTALGQDTSKRLDILLSGESEEPGLAEEKRAKMKRRCAPLDFRAFRSVCPVETSDISVAARWMFRQDGTAGQHHQASDCPCWCAAVAGTHRGLSQRSEG
ncbi:unnamed protein product [Symbiodinium sp. KB8]|nr:unnamed protein product [Symbiodinium sp. KB8]